MSTHHMITRSKSKKTNNQNNQNNQTDVDMISDDDQQQDTSYQQQDTYNKPMQYMQESLPNFYDSQQVCCARELSMYNYYQEALMNYPDNINIYLQHLFDLGCSLFNLQIIYKDFNNNFILNKNFGDYFDWSFSEQNVVNNCYFLRQMGHPHYV